MAPVLCPVVFSGADTAIMHLMVEVSNTECVCSKQDAASATPLDLSFYGRALPLVYVTTPSQCRRPVVCQHLCVRFFVDIRSLE